MEAAAKDWTEIELQEALKDSSEMKDEANKLFVKNDWASAIAVYTQALACLPQSTKKDTKGPKPSNDEAISPVDLMENAEMEHKEVQIETGTPDKQLTPLEKECLVARVTLNSNIAACQLKLNSWQEAVDAATNALEEDPHHHKALWRRAKANEAIGSWSSLTSAQKDYTTLTTIIQPSQPLHRDASAILSSLQPRIDTARQKDVDQMMGQLKTVGDSVLGWFGLSTDNFKMTPNGEGGYSMNFVNNP